MGSARVLQVSNISPFATKEQIQALFAYVGRIEDFKLYPSDFSIAQGNQQPKFAYIKFEDERGVEVGQHLTNTVFLDRALVCVQWQSNTIPDEETAVQSGSVALPGQRQLPPHISNQVQDMGDGQKMIVTVDPNLAALGLPAYPPLPPTTEPAKVEEIRRTVYVGNLPKGCEGEELLGFFNACIGEVMYLRMAAGNDYLPCDYAYVEFSQQASVPLALQNSDTLEFQGNPLRIQHSKVAIIKPQRKTAEQSLEEVEEAIRGGAIGGIMDIGRGYSPHLPGVTPVGAAALPARQASPATSTRSATRRRSPSKSRSRSPRRRSRSRRRRSPSRSRSSSYSRSNKQRRSRSKRRSRSRTRRSRSRSPRKRSSSRRRSRSRKRSSERKEGKKKQQRSSRSRERSSAKEKESSSSKKREKDKDTNKKEEKDRPERGSRKEEKKDREREKDKESGSSASKKDRKRSRSPKKEKSDREEKSSKKSKRSSDDSPKKAKKDKEPSAAAAVAEGSEPPSTRTNASGGDTPSSSVAVPTAETGALTLEKPQKKEPMEVEEEESLRERLLERVKLKHQQQKSESDD